MVKQGIFIFTRDLRLRDNLALNRALEWSEAPVICLFVFRKVQIGEGNDYRSDNSIEFMMDSLRELGDMIREKGGRLSFLYETDRTNKELYKALKGVSGEKCIFMSRGITPFAIQREKDIPACLVENHLLNDASRDIRTSSGGIYTTFRPFYEKVIANGVSRPASLSRADSFSGRRLGGSVSLSQMEILLCRSRVSPGRIVMGGEEEGRRVLFRAKRRLKDYKETRDTFSKETSYLSAYHHYGCVSVRETFHVLKEIPGIRRQLIFREYAYHQMMGWHDTNWRDPREIGESIKWKRDRSLENAWKNGRTGVPLVDAGMRQLKLEGYMHNRARMVVANFLIKNMNIHWRIGEKHFARWLTDYDWSVNFMNWIQIASILPTDTYLRDMNPYIQAKKYDRDLTYIRKYVVELRDEDPKDIFSQDRDTPIGDYPAPIVNYTKSKKEYQKWAKTNIGKFHPDKE